MKSRYMNSFRDSFTTVFLVFLTALPHRSARADTPAEANLVFRDGLPAGPFRIRKE